MRVRVRVRVRVRAGVSARARVAVGRGRGAWPMRSSTSLSPLVGLASIGLTGMPALSCSGLGLGLGQG